MPRVCHQSPLCARSSRIPYGKGHPRVCSDGREPDQDRDGNRLINQAEHRCDRQLALHNTGMSNIATILKAEISRVARKEVRTEIETLKKASTQHRSAIAALRRQIDGLEKELHQVSTGSTRARLASDSAELAEQGPARRFSAGRLVAHRSKLGLSAAAYGKLVGVSGQTIYHWEQGKARPRAAQLEALASVRSLGKREAGRQLETE